MSNEHVIKTIEMVQAQIQGIEKDLSDKKRTVNDLCRLAGRPAIYADADLAVQNGTLSFRSDEFYGKPLASVVRQILEKRASANLGAASVNEIYDAMVAGGYHFAAKNNANARGGLYISLGKNTTTFHKLPNGNYGLVVWYPTVREQRSKTDAVATAVLDSNESFSLEDVVVEELEEQNEQEEVAAGKPKAK